MTVSDDAIAVCLALGFGLTGVSATLAALFGPVSWTVGAAVQFPVVGAIFIVGWVFLTKLLEDLRDVLRGPDPDAGVEQ